jgi:hypothetical protein
MVVQRHRQLDDVGRGTLTGQGGLHRQAAILLPAISAQTLTGFSRRWSGCGVPAALVTRGSAWPAGRRTPVPERASGRTRTAGVKSLPDRAAISGRCCLREPHPGNTAGEYRRKGAMRTAIGCHLGDRCHEMERVVTPQRVAEPCAAAPPPWWHGSQLTGGRHDQPHHRGAAASEVGPVSRGSHGIRRRSGATPYHLDHGNDPGARYVISGQSGTAQKTIMGILYLRVLN